MACGGGGSAWRLSVQGQASDIMIHAEEIIKMRRRLERLYVKHTDQDPARIGAMPCANSLRACRLWGDAMPIACRGCSSPTL